MENKFEVGKVYVGSYDIGCAYDLCSYEYRCKITRRTEKSVWFTYEKVCVCQYGKDTSYVVSNGTGMKRVKYSNEFGEYFSLDCTCDIWGKDKL